MADFFGTSGDDRLAFTYLQGAFTWDAGDGDDTLVYDATGDAAPITSYQLAGGNGITFHIVDYSNGADSRAIHIEHISISGGSGNDDLSGTVGADTLIGGAGNDKIDSSSGADSLDGGDGYDTVSIERSTSTANLTYDVAAAMASTGTTLADGTVVKNFESLGYLVTGLGNDKLILGHGIFGAFSWSAGTGDDTFVYDDSSATAGSTGLRGVFGGDDSDGGSEYQLFDYAYIGTGTAHNIEHIVITGGGGNDSIQGSSGSDTLIGGTGADTLDGGKGNDSLNGGAGDDVITAGPGSGADTIDGGDGTDSLTLDRSTATNAIIFSATAAATSTGTILGDGTTIMNVEKLISLATGSGDDTFILTVKQMGFSFHAGAGDDTLVFDATGDTSAIEALMTGADSDGGFDYWLRDHATGAIFGADHLEHVSMTGGSGADSMGGGNYSDTLIGAAGNDVLDGGAGGDTLYGGAGNDTYYVDNAGDLVSETTNPGIDDGGNDTVVARISYTLGSLIENLTLDGTGDLSGSGNALANIIVGNGGNNSLLGADGNDTIDGGAGNDYIDGGAGNDSLAGSAGNDTLQGADGNDMIDGGADNDYLDGGTGSDSLNGSAGNDTLRGGDGDDAIDGGVDNDYIDGGAGSDNLAGSAGNDTLLGADGNDMLGGGTGLDVLDGGAGVDVAIILSTAAASTIMVDGNGHVIVTNASQTETLVNIEQMQFSDGIISTNNAAAVANGYEGFFGRAPTASELAYWGQALSSGTTIAAFDRILANDPAGKANAAHLIEYLYDGYFGRAPSAGESNYWILALQSGSASLASLNAVLANDASGKAYLGTSIKTLYNTFTGGDPNAGEVTIWTNALQTGTSDLHGFERVLAAQLGASANETAFVTQAYQTWLGHAPTTDDLSYWIGQLSNGLVMPVQLRAALLNDASGQAHTAATITAAYSTWFGRDPSASELNVWKGLINNGADFKTLRTALINDSAGQAHITAAITSYYVSYFGRDPSSSELGVWKGLINKGADLTTLRSALVNDGAGQAHTASEVAGLYQTYFGRAPATSESNVWKDMITGGQTFSQMHDALVGDASGKAHAVAEISALYLAIEGRAPGSNETSYWTDVLNGGASNLDTLIDTLLRDGGSHIATTTATAGHAATVFVDVLDPLVINGFGAGDQINFHGAAFDGFNPLDHAVQIGADVLIYALDSTHMVLLENEQLSSLGTANFVHV